MVLILKLEVPPESVKPEVESSCCVPELLTMLMASFCQAAPSIGPVVPLRVALALEKLTVPKFAKGNTPNIEEGASSIHSAEDRFARFADCVVEYDWLPSVMDNVNFPEPS